MSSILAPGRAFTFVNSEIKEEDEKLLPLFSVNLIYDLFQSCLPASIESGKSNKKLLSLSIQVALI